MTNLNFSKYFATIFITILIYYVSHCMCFTSFVFGDSLVDAGNNNYFFTLSKADLFPYGIDFKQFDGKPTGRFTNGRTISDIIGQSLGAKSFPPPNFAPSSQDQATIDGINYASGASGILDETGYFFIGRVRLKEQVKNFEEDRKYMVSVMGEKATRELLKKAIFSFTIGSNDILNYIQPSLPFLHHKVSNSTFQDFMVSNLTIHLKRLHELGARKFVVVGIGPLGCIPFVRALNLLSNQQCSTKVNQLIQQYNQKLKHKLTQLNQQLGPQSIFVYANSYDIFIDIISNYHHYGFDNANKPCCGGYLPPFVCFMRKNTTNLNSNLCQDRSKYVFWDAYHPTEAANIIISNKLLHGDTHVVSPINVRQLYELKS